jgi:hypothetical protein
VRKTKLWKKLLGVEHVVLEDSDVEEVLDGSEIAVVRLRPWTACSPRPALRLDRAEPAGGRFGRQAEMPASQGFAVTGFAHAYGSAVRLQSRAGPSAFLPLPWSTPKSCCLRRHARSGRPRHTLGKIDQSAG